MGNCNYRGDDINKEEVVTSNLKNYENSVSNNEYNIKVAKGGLYTNNNALSSKDISIHVEEEVASNKQDFNNLNNKNLLDDADNNILIAQDPIYNNYNNHNHISISEEKIKELNNAISKHGLISDIETMNAKTSPIILEVEFREKLDDYYEGLKSQYLFKSDLINNNEVIQFFNGSFYIGSWNHDLKKHGYGKLLMLDGSKYCGEFNSDVFEGNGYFIDPHGRLYVGEFKNGKATGKGKITTEKEPGYLYTGEFENNLYHGEGEERFANGNVYKGKFTNGFKEPYGKLIFADGSEYEGNFSKNIIEGKGRFKWRDGRTYSGDFHDSKLHGKGKTTWIDGSYYEGEYKNDNFNGYGESRSSGGSIFKGYWLNNNIHGLGYFKDDKNEYKGLWRFNKNIKKF